MKACGFADPPCCWDDVVDWGISKFHGKSLQACLGRLCFGSAMYHLWKHQNDLQHGNIPSSEEAILIQIFWDVRTKILDKGRFKSLPSCLELVYRWNLHSFL
jgi:hypothetical protein